MPTEPPGLPLESTADPDAIVDCALASIERVLDRQERAMHDGKRYGDIFDFWEDLGKLLFGYRATIDPDGFFGLPDHVDVKHSPTLHAIWHDPEAAHEAALVKLRPDYILYCWAAFYCLQRATGGPCLAAFPDARLAVNRAYRFLQERVVWAHRQVLWFLTDLHYERDHDKLMRIREEFTSATLEVVRWLREYRKSMTTGARASVGEPQQTARGDVPARVNRAPNVTEQDVMDWLFEEGFVGLESIRAVPANERPTAERIAPGAITRDSDGQFKATLRHMIDLGWLDNGRNHGLRSGYFLTPLGEAMVSKNRKSGPSQD